MVSLPLRLTDDQRALKAGVAEICKRYPGEYWRELDAKREYPEAFVNELTRTGYLACLIPHEYGGAGLGLREGGLILETIHANGGSASACHAQMYIMGLEIRPLRMMMNHSTNALFFDDMEIPAASLIGAEGQGFQYILSGMNAERILVASESIGDGRWFTDKAAAYGSQRVIFGKPIGMNQGVQFPIARAYANVEAAALMRDKAAALFDAGEPCGAEANMAKLLAADAAWEAGNACIDCHGGYGYAEEYDVERKFRECRLYKTAPVNNNLVLAYLGEHVLGMPRSY